jgi:chitodextrinase
MKSRHRPLNATILALVMTAIALPSSPAGAVEVFSDGFESGTLAAWTSTTGFSVQQGITWSGAFAGRATASSGAAHATKSLDAAHADLYVRAFVHVVSHSGSTPLLRVRSATGKVIASLNVKATDQLVLKNMVSGATLTSTVTMGPGAFRELQLHTFVSGNAGRTDVWVDGAPVAALSGTQNLGTSPVDRVVLGRHNGGTKPMDVVFDDVVVSTTFIGGGGGGTPPLAPTGLTGSAPSSDQVNLSWNASAGATGYNVVRDGAFLATTGSTSFSDTTVQPETTYRYTVQAFNSAGPSPVSDFVDVTTPPESSGGSTVVMAAGDIACDPADSSYNGGNGTSSKCRQKWTAQLLAGADRVLALGDTQYDCGGLSAFNQSYHPTWGQYKDITHPILSDEDFDSSGTGCGPAGADGYFAYWGSKAGPNPAGYYSFDVGGWHIIALNSECNDVPGGCGEGSPQNNWLEQDLAASGAQCTIAMLHEPRFRSKKNGAQVGPDMKPFWDDLHAGGAEMVLSGDSHFYERFRPQNPNGGFDANGVVQWVVGVGGKSRGGLAGQSARLPNSQKATSQTFGVLKLTLEAGSYDWEFLVEGSNSFSDTGSASCH